MGPKLKTARSVEIRNPEYLGPAYFALLVSHNVAHVFTTWTRMPELAKQIAMEGPKPPTSRSRGRC